MKILFIKSTLNSVIARSDFGIGSLSATLKKHGHQVGLFVVNKWTDIPMLTHRINLTKPDMLAFSTYAATFQSTVKISNLMRKQYPKLLQILGGIHIILNPNNIQYAPSIDAVCVGEGEQVLLQFINKYVRGDGSHLYTEGFWTRKKGVVIKNSSIPFITNLDDLPFPDREIFNQQVLSPSNVYGREGLVLEFLFTRGCPFDCTYCSNHALRNIYGAHRYVRRMSPKRAIEWIRRDLSIYACNRISIVDDTFTLDKKWVDEFLDLYKEIRFPFDCQLRVGTFDKNMLRKLKRAGCVAVAIGVESGDERFRKEILKRSMTNNELINAFENLKKIRIQAIALFMIGLPGENPKMWLKTVKLIAKIYPDICLLATFYPFPGTELHRIAKNMGFLRHKPRWDFIADAGTTLTMPNFTPRDISYFRTYIDTMIHQATPTNDYIRQLHRNIKLFLLSVPPHSSYFKLTQSLVYIDDKTFQLLYYIEKIINPKKRESPSS